MYWFGGGYGSDTIETTDFGDLTNELVGRGIDLAGVSFHKSLESGVSHACDR